MGELAARGLSILAKLLERLDALEHFVEGVVKLAVLSNAAPQDRFQIRQIGNVDDLIDAVHEGAHRVIGGETVTEQDDEMLTTLCIGTCDQLRQDWV